MTCPACRAEAPDGARFCPTCGHDLRLRGDERRVVTVLFADLVGFTTLSETRDPEQIKNLVDRCFERLVVDIEAFGGRVDKIIGDAIVALFGAPVAHEDDAERAVRAALQMHHTLTEVAEGQGFQVRMRVGVNSGEVLVGALRAGGSTTAMGDVVNTASRLQTAAKPGEVLVGAATYAATRRVVSYEAREPVQAKGREEPVVTWVAKEALLPPGYRPTRERAPLIGRESELGILKHSVDAAVTHRRANLLLILGEAGVGKSRLAEEIAAAASCDHDALVLEGRCVPYGEANVWWPVADALRHGIGLEAGDEEPVARERTSASVGRALGETSPDADRVTNGLLHLMGYEGALRDIDALRAREEAAWALVTFAEQFARQRPVVVVLSDLHWADDLVLELIDTLVERLLHQRFVFVATARPILEERWSPRSGRHNVVVLNLDPLGAVASRELLNALAGTELEDGLASMLLDRSGGNPFFLEELVTLLAEAGVVGSSPGQTGVELPDTLRGLVSARLDALLPAERQLLESASVLGRAGPVMALEVMSREAHGVLDWEPLLESLVGKDLLVIDGDSWSFRSDLVREVAYGTLTKGDRARAHAGIAKWVEHKENHLHDAVLDRIAHHYARAAELVAELGPVDLVPADITERALLWLERAANRAEQTDVPVVAARLYGESIRLLSDEPSARRRMYLLGRARALGELRELVQARSDASIALKEARAEGEQTDEARALLVLADIEQKDNRSDVAAGPLGDAMAIFEALGDDAGRAEALRLRGFGALLHNDFESAWSSLDAALELFCVLGDRRGEAWALQNLSWCAFMTGQLDEAESRLRQSVATFEEIGDQGGLGWALGLLAFTRFQKGFSAEAEALAESVLASASERGDKWGHGMMLVLLAGIRCWSGRTYSAIDAARAALELFEGIHDDFGRFQAIGPLGRSLISAGRIEEGFAELEQLRTEISPEMADRQRAFFLMAMLSGAVQIGDTDLAASVLETLPVMHGHHSDDTIGELAVTAAVHQLQRGDATGALPLLAGEAAYNGYRRSSLALALAADGQTDAALDTATEVLGNDMSTYLDRTSALIARGLALASRHDAAGSDAAFTDARELVDATEDRVGQATVRLAMAAAGDALDAAGSEALRKEAASRLGDLGIEANGWQTAYRLAAGLPVADVTLHI